MQAFFAAIGSITSVDELLSCPGLLRITSSEVITLEIKKKLGGRHPKETTFGGGYRKPFYGCGLCLDYWSHKRYSVQRHVTKKSCEEKNTVSEEERKKRTLEQGRIRNKNWRERQRQKKEIENPNFSRRKNRQTDTTASTPEIAPRRQEVSHTTTAASDDHLERPSTSPLAQETSLEEDTDSAGVEQVTEPVHREFTSYAHFHGLEKLKVIQTHDLKLLKLQASDVETTEFIYAVCLEIRLYGILKKDGRLY